MSKDLGIKVITLKSRQMAEPKPPVVPNENFLSELRGAPSRFVAISSVRPYRSKPKGITVNRIEQTDMVTTARPSNLRKKARHPDDPIKVTGGLIKLQKSFSLVEAVEKLQMLTNDVYFFVIDGKTAAHVSDPSEIEPGRRRLEHTDRNIWNIRDDESKRLITCFNRNLADAFLRELVPKSPEAVKPQAIKARASGPTAPAESEPEVIEISVRPQMAEPVTVARTMTRRTGEATTTVPTGGKGAGKSSQRRKKHKHHK